MSEIFTTRKGKCFNKTWGKTMTEAALSFKDEDEVGLKNQGKTKSKCLTEKLSSSLTANNGGLSSIIHSPQIEE